MLKIRVIPTLLYRDFGLVKGTDFDSRRAVGGAMQAIKVYEMRGVDELILLDVTATPQQRGPDLRLIDDLADECFMPFTVGGGVRSVDDVRNLLEVGADKVAIGTATVETPDVVDAAAGRFGAQCVVAVIDVRRDESGRQTVWVRSGSEDTGVDPVALARELESRGAGELLVQSIDRDGRMQGYDLDLIRSVSDAVRVPVVASGGAGRPSDLAAAVVDGGASAVAAAAMFHFTEQTPAEVKEHLRSAGLPVRR